MKLRGRGRSTTLCPNLANAHDSYRQIGAQASPLLCSALGFNPHLKCPVPSLFLCQCSRPTSSRLQNSSNFLSIEFFLSFPDFLGLPLFFFFLSVPNSSKSLSMTGSHCLHLGDKSSVALWRDLLLLSILSCEPDLHFSAALSLASPTSSPTSASFFSPSAITSLFLSPVKNTEKLVL